MTYLCEMPAGAIGLRVQRIETRHNLTFVIHWNIGGKWKVEKQFPEGLVHDVFTNQWRETKPYFQWLNDVACKKFPGEHFVTENLLVAGARPHDAI